MSRASLVRLVLLLAAALLAGDAAWAQAPELAQLGEVQPEAEGSRLSTALEIALLLTALSLLPAILITVTSFTRIVIVLSFVRRALSVNELPPNPVLIGLALFLTLFVMAPVGERLHAEVWQPYKANELTLEEAGDAAWQELGTFLVANTRPGELAMFSDLDAGRIGPQELEVEGLDQGWGPMGGSRPVEASFTKESPLDPADRAEADELPEALPPMTVVVPAFVLSELKTAFQMGFLLFLPFLVIDLIVSSVLLSMGMFMLPPVMISTPIKILVFVLVDGWRLISESVVTSFMMAG